MLRCPRPALLRILRLAAPALLVCLALLPTAGRGQDAPAQDHHTYLSSIRFSYPPAAVILRVEDIRDWVRLPGGPPTNTEAALYFCPDTIAGPVCGSEPAVHRRADGDGVIVFSGLRSGSYMLTVSAAGYQMARSVVFPVTETTVIDGRVDLLPANPVQIALEGRVLDETGELLPPEVASRLRISSMYCTTPLCPSPKPAGDAVNPDSTGAFRAAVNTSIAAGYYRVGVTDPASGEYAEALSAITPFVLPGSTGTVEPVRVALHPILLRGRIVDAAAGEPPANVTSAVVSLTRCTDRGCASESRRAAVNAEGRFTVSAAQPGRYALSVALPPYDSGGLPALELAAIDRRNVGDVALEPLRYARSVDGRLTNGGEPLANSWLTFYRYRFERCTSEPGAATSDSAGAFRFPAPAQRMVAGDFILRSSGPGQLIRYLGPFTLAEDEALDLGALEVNATPQAPAGVISGRLVISTTEGIQPIPGTATLVACGPCGCQDTVRSVGTNAAGEFAFEGALPSPLPAGRYLVSAAAADSSSGGHGESSAFDVGADEDVAVGDVLLAAAPVEPIPIWLYDTEPAPVVPAESKPAAEIEMR